MITAAHNYFILKLFDIYFPALFKRHFRKMECIPKSISSEKERSVLLIGNHISWWDGIWVYLLNKVTFRKKLFVMMLHDQLQKNMILRYGGAYALKKGSRSALNALDYTREVLQEPGNMVLMFPQGRIHSQLSDKFSFQKGIGRLTDTPSDIYFFAAFVDYGAYKKPTLRYYLHKQESAGAESLEESYNRFYTRSREKHERYVQDELL